MTDNHFLIIYLHLNPRPVFIRTSGQRFPLPVLVRKHLAPSDWLMGQHWTCWKLSLAKRTNAKRSIKVPQFIRYDQLRLVYIHFITCTFNINQLWVCFTSKYSKIMCQKFWIVFIGWSQTFSKKSKNLEFGKILGKVLISWFWASKTGPKTRFWNLWLKQFWKNCSMKFQISALNIFLKNGKLRKFIFWMRGRKIWFLSWFWTCSQKFSLIWSFRIF